MEGEIAPLAGDPNLCFSTTGDNGPAAAAGLNLSAMAYHAATNRLFLSSFDRIRVIDLTTGIISLFAVTGTANAPAHGDGGPATSASQLSRRGIPRMLNPDGEDGPGERWPGWGRGGSEEGWGREGRVDRVRPEFLYFVQNLWICNRTGLIREVSAVL